jgi:hypothetical protein
MCVQKLVFVSGEKQATAYTFLPGQAPSIPPMEGEGIDGGTAAAQAKYFSTAVK